MLALAAMALSVSLADTASETAGNHRPRLSLRVGAVEKEWSEQSRCTVRLSISPGGTAVSADAIPSLVLRRKGTEDPVERMRDQYWAPFDLKSGRALRMNDRSNIVLKRSEDISLNVSACDLHWARQIQGAWPFQSLHEAVAAGSYELFFEIEIVGPGLGQKLRSEGVPLSVR